MAPRGAIFTFQTLNFYVRRIPWQVSADFVAYTIRRHWRADERALEHIILTARKDLLCLLSKHETLTRPDKSGHPLPLEEGLEFQHFVLSFWGVDLEKEEHYET